MGEILKIEKERVLEASEDCEEFKNVAKTLWPEIFKKKEEWEDITDEVTWKARKEDEFWLMEVWYEGEVFGHMWANGKFYIARNNCRMEKSDTENYFRILKIK